MNHNNIYAHFISVYYVMVWRVVADLEAVLVPDAGDMTETERSIARRESPCTPLTMSNTSLAHRTDLRLWPLSKNDTL